LIRLLADENVPRVSVERLRAAGLDVAEARQGSTDRAVLERAAADGRVIVIFDGDFGRLALQGDAPRPAGVVLLRDAPMDPEAPARIFLELLARDDLRFENALTVVRSGRVRQRRLRGAFRTAP
jgi:predicted nuclease of predicted toxin-antitoxin system